MRLGLSSDLHVHRHDQADDIAALVAHINAHQDLDVYVYAGDLSHRTEEIVQFLESITLPCPKLWLPGNHDVWVIDQEHPQDTADHRYETLFPKISQELGWHYLPTAPYQHGPSGHTFVGTIGWFSGPGFSEWYDQEADERNEALALRMAANLRSQIEALPERETLVVVTHHLPHVACLPNGARSSGKANAHIEALLAKEERDIALVVHGHHHIRYALREIDGIPHVAHPFGYPHQHASVADGLLVMEL